MTNTESPYTEVALYAGDVRLYGRYFKARAPEKGNFLLLHGLTSNSAWFVKIAEILSVAGFNVLVYDRRGSGQSSGRPGDVPEKEAFFADMKLAAEFIWSKSSQPLHLMAFSYSWKLSPVFVRKLESADRKIESLIFVAPASDLRSQIKPRLKDVLKILFNWNGPYFAPPIRDSDLTKNPETLTWIRNSSDSRPQQKFTRRFYLASQAIERDAGHLVPALAKPMLTILPRQDNVIDLEKVRARFSKGPAGSARKVVEIDGSHIVDTAEAQRALAENVLAWVGAKAGNGDLSKDFPS